MAIVNRKLSSYEKEYYNKQNKQQEAIWAQQQKEAQQGLDTAKWTQGYQTTELKRNVGTNVINRGVARGTIGSGMIAQGMTPINQQYQQSLQTYNNWLAQNGLDRAAWAIQQWANTHKESSAVKAKPKAPGPSPASLVSGDPFTGQKPLYGGVSDWDEYTQQDYQMRYNKWREEYRNYYGVYPD
jgi:hypothetical protein